MTRAKLHFQLFLDQERPTAARASVAMTRNGRVHSIRKLLNMEIVEDVPPRKRKAAMKSIVRATVYGVLNHCIKEYFYESCEGCTINAPAQDAHACLTWTAQNVDSKIKFICNNICTTQIVVVANCIGYGLQSLVFTQESMDQIFNLLNKVGDAVKSQRALEKILKDSDKIMLHYVQGYLKEKSYKVFLINQENKM